MERMFNIAALLALTGALWAGPAPAEPPPLSAFAHDANMSGLTLSPDGRYLSWIATVGGVRSVLVKELSAPQSRISLVMSGPKDYKW